MTLTGFIKVCESEGSETVEVPLEADGTLLLTTLTAQFPKCTGLKYLASETHCFRGLRLVGDRIHPPFDSDWPDNVFYCVFPKDNNKRKSDEDTEDTKQKVKCFGGKKCTDLIVLNLAWHTDETKLRNYFSQFGNLVMVQIKRDPDTGKSRGYGFIRFSDYAGQVMCLAERHLIDDRLCEVRVPLSKLEGDRQEVHRKIHVGHLTEDIGVDSLRQHFSQYGRVVDVFIPKPFRSFAFVTFEDSDVASSLLGKEVVIKDCNVVIGSAVPKLPAQSRSNGSSATSSRQPVSPLNSTAQAGGGQLWTSPGSWPASYGMFSTSNLPGSQQSSLMGRGSEGPIGLNPAAAAAAAALAAQYTRAHQRQCANGSTVSGLTEACGSEGKNGSALALNLLNNPSVVAAIVSAAAGALAGSPSR